MAINTESLVRSAFSFGGVQADKALRLLGNLKNSKGSHQVIDLAEAAIRGIPGLAAIAFASFCLMSMPRKK